MPVQPIPLVLLAAGLDWLEGLLPLLFVVIWIASQVMNLFRGARKAGEPPPRQPPRPAGGGRAAGPQADPDVTREIEAFLRRSLQADEPRPRPAADQGAGKTSRRRSRRAAAGPPPVPVNEQGSRLAEGSVAGHVAAAFAHDLAHESPDAMAATAAAAPVSTAADLAAAIRGPGGLRQLVLMQEVLTRPTHRW